MRHSLQGTAAAYLVCAAAILMLGALPAIAADAPSEAVPTTDSSTAAVEQPTTEQLPVLDLSGFMAFVDPETGELRAPTEQEAAALAQALRVQLPQDRQQARAQAPTVESLILDNGLDVETVLLDLNSASVSIARVQADGSVAFECAQNHDHSEHAAQPAGTQQAGSQPVDM